MEFDLDRLSPGVAYRILTAVVVPRPIAWVTTRDPEGRINAAPYSFFNAMGGNPPVVAIGCLRDPAKGLKDTPSNILETGEFVVNLVPERLARAMNATSADAPRGMDELALAGLSPAPALKLGCPRILGAPAALECRLMTSVETGPQQVLIVGRVVAIHVEDAFVTDPARGHVDTAAMGLIGRMHGAGWYARTTDLFALDRPAAPTRPGGEPGGGGPTSSG